jgi:hypothetical protein
MRLVINAAQPIGGVAAALMLLGGTLRACGRGGFPGFVHFIFSLLFAAVIYVAIQVWIESLRIFVDIEQNSRELLHATRDRSGPASPVS